MSAFGDFVALHRAQLEHTKLPEGLWLQLYQKLASDTFDAGEAFTFGFAEAETPQWTLLTLKDIEAEANIWLVDHALGFTDLAVAVAELRQQPALLRRLAVIAEVPEEALDGAADEGQLLQLLVDRLHTVVYEFVVQSSAEAESRQKYRYIMDEVGSRLSSAPVGEAAGFCVVPFLWSKPVGAELLSLMWPLRHVAAGELATRYPRLGMANYNSHAYWEHRFRQESDKDWYCELETLLPLLERYCGSQAGVPAGDGVARRSILLPGCGNSDLGPQIAAAGFGRVTNVDYVSGVIQGMGKKHGDGGGTLEWVAADLTTRTQWDDAAFDAIIDKATLDALLTSKQRAEITERAQDASSPPSAGSDAPDIDHQQWGDTTAGDLVGVRAYLAEMRRLVADGGVFMLVSLRTPPHVLPLLGIEWDASPEGEEEASDQGTAPWVLKEFRQVEGGQAARQQVLNLYVFMAA